MSGKEPTVKELLRSPCRCGSGRKIALCCTYILDNRTVPCEKIEDTQIVESEKSPTALDELPLPDHILEEKHILEDRSEFVDLKIETVTEKLEEDLAPDMRTNPSNDVSSEDMNGENLLLNASTTSAASEDSLCGYCGVGVPSSSQQAEIQVDVLSEHGKTVRTYSSDTFWIACDICKTWYHGLCVDVDEFEDVWIEAYHCPKCQSEHGPSICKDVLVPHRLHADDVAEKDFPMEIGSKAWIEQFSQTEVSIRSPDPSKVVICEDGNEFSDQFDKQSDWKKVYLIKKPAGLSMRMPEPGQFTVDSLVEYFGERHMVDTIDVYRQQTQSMSLGKFRDKMAQAPPRQRLYNFLSLEFSANDRMKQLVAPPLIVMELSYVHRLWPDVHDVINWDPEVAVLEEHQAIKPEVALFCLCGMAGSYTDFHIDFGGSTVWYHIYKGKKIFYIVEPTESNLAAFEKHQAMEKRSEHFFADMIPKSELRRVEILEGQTLMVPSGWIHSVYTPEDALVFGGNYLHELNVPMQLKVYDMEMRLRKSQNLDAKFFYPQFELVHWYAGRSFLIDALREANDERNMVSPCVTAAAGALIPRLREWLDRDRDNEALKLSCAANTPVLTRLQAEYNKQLKLQANQSPRKKRLNKARRSRGEDSDDEYPAKNATKGLKVRIKRVSLEGQKPKEVPEKLTRFEQEDERIKPDDVPSEIASVRVQEEFLPENAVEVPRNAIESSSFVHEEDADEPLKLLFTKNAGNRYSAEVVEPTQNLLGDVNMAKMFARESSSGRKRKQATWLHTALGDEIKKEADIMQEEGDIVQPRELLEMNNAELDALQAEDEKEFTKEKRVKTKSKSTTNSIKAAVSSTLKPKVGATAKQRLASKLKMLK